MTKLRYGEQPVGVNKLKHFMKTICDKAGLKGNYSNHSGKRSCATSLYQAGIDEQEIMSRTGHRSEKACRKYKVPSSEVLKRTSAALNPPSPKRVKSETEAMSDENVKVGLCKTETPNSCESKATLSDITNKLGSASDGVFFTNCTFQF